MRSAHGASRLSTGLSAGVGLLGIVLLGVTQAQAGVGGSATPTWPASATVGDIISTSVVVVNTSTTPNENENVTLATLFVTPACKSAFASICIGTDVDPGIFKVLSAVGDASTAPCSGTSFTVGAPNPSTGEVALTPTSTVTLGPASGPEASRTCLVNLALRVFQVPTNPVTPGSGTTDPLARATLVGDSSGLNGSAGGSAQITINKATPGLSTSANPNTGGIAAGTSVTDTATVTKAPGAITPTGSVRFILCQPNEVNAAGCPSPAGTKIGADIPLAGNSATSEATNNTTTPGTYCWRARYLGDANYNPVNHTNRATECFTVEKQPSNTATQASTNSTSVVPGASVTDLATVTGGAGQPTPTGTVVFFLCQPNEVTAGQGCLSPAGTQIGSAKTLNASGQATSDGTTNTTAIGQYCWRAVYSGDGFYNGSSHTNAASECFTTVKQPSSTATLSSPTGDNVVPGTSVTDTATVTGGAGQPTPTGTVTFFLCQPNEVTAGQGCVSPAGTQVGVAKALNVSGQTTSDGTTNTNAAGTYCWRAEYSGDAFYNGSSHTDATSECFSTLLYRVTVIVCTAEATPRFHSSNVTLGASTVPSASAGVATELCAAAANFNNLDAGVDSITVNINPNDPNTP